MDPIDGVSSMRAACFQARAQDPRAGQASDRRRPARPSPSASGSRRRWGAAALVAALWVAPAWADQGAATDRIGRVRSVEGAVFVVRNGAPVPAAVGQVIQRGDVIRTGKPGAVGLVLNDETTISLGSTSELALLEFAFEPKDGRFALVVRMAKGTFAYLAGLIGKLAPGAIQLQLPDSTVAVRGTRLLITVGE